MANGIKGISVHGEPASVNQRPIPLVEDESSSDTIELQRPISNIPEGGTSLVDVTCRLVLATQRGRACTQHGKALYHKWTLIGPPQAITLEFGDGYLAWGGAFENNPLHGVRLIMVPKTV